VQIDFAFKWQDIPPVLTRQQGRLDRRLLSSTFFNRECATIQAYPL
jgi:hypothetical protein